MTIKVTLMLPNPLVEAIDDVASQLDTTRTDVIKHILEDFFGDEEVEASEESEEEEDEEEEEEEEESEE